MTLLLEIELQFEDNVAVSPRSSVSLLEQSDLFVLIILVDLAELLVQAYPACMADLTGGCTLIGRGLSPTAENDT